MLEQMRPSDLGMWIELYGIDKQTGEFVARVRPDSSAAGADLSARILSFMKPKMQRRA